MVLCLLFLGSLFTPVAYHDPLLFAELLGHYQPSSHRIFAGLTAQAVVPANSMFSKIKDMAAESRFFRR